MLLVVRRVLLGLQGLQLASHPPDKAEAIAIFQLNHEQFPESAKARARLAEAQGRQEP